MEISTPTMTCVKAATNIVGDKWTPLLLRMFFAKGSVRFCQLQELVPGINPRTLSARLSKLEASEIIYKVGETRCEYSLTSKGLALLPILKDMEAWSEKYR